MKYKIQKIRLGKTYGFEIIDKDGWCLVGGYDVNPLKAILELIKKIIRK